MIIYVQSLSFRLANFIFGKTTIFVVIVGWYLIITGLLFLVRPNKARARLARSGFAVVQLNIILICFFLWGILSKLSQALSGNAQAIVFWGGLAGLFILFFRARAAARKKLAALTGQLPLKVLMWFACGQVVMGGLIVYLQHRLW